MIIKSKRCAIRSEIIDLITKFDHHEEKRVKVGLFKYKTEKTIDYQVKYFVNAPVNGQQVLYESFTTAKERDAIYEDLVNQFVAAERAELKTAK